MINSTGKFPKREANLFGFLFLENLSFSPEGLLIKPLIFKKPPSISG